MITQWLLSFFFSLFQSIISLIPTTDPPAWVSSMSGYASTFWTDASDLGAWIPWATVSTVVTAWFVAFGVRIVVVVVRFTVSLFTGGGGAS